MNDTVDVGRLADAWAKTQMTKRYDLGKSQSRIVDLSEESDHGLDLYSMATEIPERTWPIILELISRYDFDDLDKQGKEANVVLGMLGAGPLEDILSYHGAAFVDRIESEARRSPKFRWVLRHVAQSTMPEVFWRRIQTAAAPE